MGMLMAERMNNRLAAPFESGVGSRPGVETTAPQVIETERAPGASGESESERRIALTRLFEQHRKRLLLTALRITRDADEAEDVVQEAAMRALMKLQTFRGEASLETWLHTIVSNCAISRLRSSARRCLISLDSEWGADQHFPRWVALEPRTDPEGICLAFELYGIIRSEMQVLKAPYRTAIQLCDLEGWSRVEAAEILKVNQNTLKARLYRGRKSLRQGMLASVFGTEQPSPQVTQFRVHTAKGRRRRKSVKLAAASKERLFW